MLYNKVENLSYYHPRKIGNDITAANEPIDTGKKSNCWFDSRNSDDQFFVREADYALFRKILFTEHPLDWYHIFVFNLLCYFDLPISLEKNIIIATTMKFVRDKLNSLY